MKRVLCVGHSAYDITYLLDTYPIENRKYKALDVKMMGGGPTGNASYLLGKYGGEVSYITTLGTDVYGREIASDLESVGVDLTNSIIKDEYVTPCSMIITNITDGSRTIVNSRKKNEIPKDYKIVCEKEPGIILFDGHEIELARLTLEKFPNAVTVLDAGSYKESCVELGAKVDYLVCSEDFVREYSKVEKIDENNYKEVFSIVEGLNKKNIIVTLGEKGCLFKEKGELYLYSAYKTKAVDTTGAGDIYHGAFVYGLSNELSIIECIKFSTVCASLSVEKIGGRESIPELEEIYDRMNSWEPIITRL